MTDKGKAVACVEEATKSVVREKENAMEYNFLGQLEKVREVVSVAKESVKSLSTNEVVSLPDDDYIEELGELDDIGVLEAINKNRLEYIALNNNNVVETEEDIRFNESVRRYFGEGEWLDSDSVEDSYMTWSESESSDSEDPEDSGDEDSGDDEEEENSGDGGPLQERPSLRELDGSERRPYFTLGMTFLDRRELRSAVDKYAIENGVNVKIVKCEKKMVIAICERGCPFRLYASRDKIGVGYIVKTLAHEHSCARVYKNPRASVRWLAEHFKEKVQENPQYSVSEMKKDVECEFKLFVSRYKCKRAKRRIMQDMEGGFVEEFQNLEAYCNELKLSNPGSDVSVELSPEALDQGSRVFRRMYVCFNSSKVGWKMGCRPFIGLDGTFLKGNARGILLTAVGLDANDSMYPISFGLTEKETGDNWTWFIQWLRSSLELDEGVKVTIMSDMQKGLAQAVSQVLPLAEHRLCARHIYANWSKKWRGHELKKFFFTCAWSTYKEKFNDNIKAMERVNKAAATGAVSYSVNGWVRAFFTNRCLSWVVDNNVCESFNAWICECRYLPVIRMFDGIRLKLMEKWAKSEQIVSSWKGNYSPKCLEIFETNRFLAVNCQIFFNGDDGYEVIEGKDRHTVQVSSRKCTCRAWDLTGIPCQHAICVMYHAKVDPVTQISRYYHRDTFIASYRTKLGPVRGQIFWEIDKFTPMLPPPVCKLPGRPPKKRKRTEEAQRRMNTSNAETSQASGNTHNTDPTPARVERFSRKGSVLKCSFCRKDGHNRSTCKEAPPSTNPRPGRKRRTPTPCASTQGSSHSPSQEMSQVSNTPCTQTPLSRNVPHTSGNQPRGRDPVDKPARNYGFGIMVDEDTGRSVYNPGLSSEKIIDEGTPPEFVHAATRQTKFPIPNEKEIRRSTAATSFSQEGSRKIDFSQPTYSPSSLAMQPPGLQWKGQPSISSSELRIQSKQILTRRRAQLQQQSDKIMTRGMARSSK